MRMKKVLFFLACLLSTTAWADGYSSLVVQTGATATALDVSGLVMTIADGELVATNASGTVKFALADLAKMYFSDAAATGVSSLRQDAGVAPAVVYDLAGRQAGVFAGSGEAAKVLPKGVYVVKQQGRTFKIAVK